MTCLFCMQELGKQLEALAQADSPAISRRSGDAAAGDGPPAAAAPGGQGGGGGTARGPLLGLQDLRGQWSGAIQAYGGGGGATAVEFNLRGRDWHWGVYELDQVRFIHLSYGFGLPSQQTTHAPKKLDDECGQPNLSAMACLSGVLVRYLRYQLLKGDS